MAELLTQHLSLIRIPSAHDKVYKDECAFCFDSPVCTCRCQMGRPEFHGLTTVRDNKKCYFNFYVMAKVNRRDSSISTKTYLNRHISTVDDQLQSFKKSFQSRKAPWGGADLRFLSPQPDTSQSHKTTDTGLVHCVVCPFK